MSTNQNPVPGKNAYFLDESNPAELARLMKQANMTSRAMNRLFPPGINPSTFQAVLDVACGPGNWVLDVAFHHPHLEALGIDISDQMINYARARASSQGLENAIFAHGDATGMLYSEAAAFDFVNARFLVGFMQPEQWSGLVLECQRILRPYGILCLTEGEWAITNSPAYQRYSRFISQSLHITGRSFSADGLDLAITPMLGKAMRDAGFHSVELQSHALEVSYGQEGYLDWLENCEILFELAKPFICCCLPITRGELDQLYTQVLIEMRQEAFCGIGYFLSIWGKKAS
jgi:ubiquinone/menaquinone biosynthesis C-methylase UbiE